MSIIEDLKANEKPFGLMSEEMQAKAKEIGCRDGKNFDIYYGAGGTWQSPRPYDFQRDRTYRLRPDFQEKPSIVECEVELDDDSGNLYCVDPSGYMPEIHVVTSRTDFVGFKFEDGRISIMPRIYASENLYEDLVKADTFDKYEVLTPTHVLFKGDKP